MALLSVLSFNQMQAEEVTEDFESVTVVDANGDAVTGNYTAGAGLSNGWTVVGGGICASADWSDFGLWSTAYGGSSKSLTAQYGSSNSAVIVIPVQVSGKISFYARKSSTSSSTKGYVYLYKMEKDGNSYKKVSSTAMTNWTLSSTTWTKYEYDMGSEACYIGISMVRAGMDDVVYNTISTEPHEHSYATEWSSDADGHWHACTSTTGYCQAQKADYAAHDGIICSVCGYKTAGIESFPWTETFEGIVTGLPAGWDNSEGTTSASYKWALYNNYTEGYSVRFDSYNNTSGKTNVLATPWIYVPAEGVYELKFKCKNPKGGDFSVKIAEYGAEERTVLFEDLTNISAWEEKTASLAAYAGKAVKVYFYGTSNWGSGDAYIYLDDVTVKESINHEHDYATAWSHDTKAHWHACQSTVGECNAPKGDYAEHTFDADDVCTVCGYDRPYMVDFEDGIPAIWTNNGFEIANNPSYGNGTKMAYAGRYADGNTLTTPRLKAQAGEIMDVEALLPWDDETLTMEYSLDNGETWNVAFAETPAANNTLTTLHWTAPEDGIYLLRFSGRYNYIDNFCGFKLAPTVLEADELTVSSTWATLCYPADVALTEGVQAFTVTGREDDSLVLTEVTGTIPAYEPVMLYSEEGKAIALPEASFVLDDIKPINGSEENLLVGCLASLKLNKNTQYVLQDQAAGIGFYKVNPSNPITTSAYRCYLELPEAVAASKLNLVIDDELPTSISGLNAMTSTAIYDLNGRKVSKMQKGGMYIIGNKKVIVK